MLQLILLLSMKGEFIEKETIFKNTSYSKIADIQYNFDDFFQICLF